MSAASCIDSETSSVRSEHSSGYLADDERSSIAPLAALDYSAIDLNYPVGALHMYGLCQLPQERCLYRWREAALNGFVVEGFAMNVDGHFDQMVSETYDSKEEAVAAYDLLLGRPSFLARGGPSHPRERAAGRGLLSGFALERARRTKH